MEVVSLQFGVESVGQVSPRLCLCAACDWSLLPEVTSKECSAIDPHAHLINYKLVFILSFFVSCVSGFSDLCFCAGTSGSYVCVPPVFICQSQSQPLSHRVFP